MKLLPVGVNATAAAVTMSALHRSSPVDASQMMPNPRGRRPADER
jgi:hypothetical protein